MQRIIYLLWNCIRLLSIFCIIIRLNHYINLFVEITSPSKAILSNDSRWNTELTSADYDNLKGTGWVFFLFSSTFIRYKYLIDVSFSYEQDWLYLVWLLIVFRIKSPNPFLLTIFKWNWSIKSCRVKKFPKISNLFVLAAKSVQTLHSLGIISPSNICTSIF